jgi:exopolysaccharide biosynthesis polyprenyl glycosylphosphotransferase
MEHVAQPHTAPRVATRRGSRMAFRPRQTLATLDSFLAAITLTLIYVFVVMHDHSDPTARTAHMLAAFLMCFLVLLLLFREGQYSWENRLSPIRDGMALARSLLIAYLIVQGMAFATKGFFTGFDDFSRLTTFASMLLLFGLLLSARLVMWWGQRRLLRSGITLRRVIVVGGGKAATDFVNFLEKRPWLGVRCTGAIALGLQGETEVRSAAGTVVRNAGGLVDARSILAENSADEFIVAMDPDDCQILHTVTETLARERLPFRVVPSLFEASYRPARLVGFEELPMIDMEVDPLDRVQRVFKRGFDLAVGLAALMVTSPLMLGSALAIKATSKGPVFFEQERLGRNGKPFQLLKFRTMVVDAEARLPELMEKNEAEGHVFKIKDDPRLTPAGGFLRKWSLDELPQLINVIRKEMSLVGPRPPLPSEVEKYETAHYSRLRGTPGITGLWQVSGRANLSFDEMVRLDRYYLDNWSTWLDLTILFRTVYVVFARRGAY